MVAYVEALSGVLVSLDNCEKTDCYLQSILN